MAIRAVLLLMWIALFISTAAKDRDKPCQTCSVVDNALPAYSQLHTGMKRAELERYFRPYGGLSTLTFQTYVFRHCPMITVDVRFEKPGSPNDYYKADNNIRNFERLYIDYEVMD